MASFTHYWKGSTCADMAESEGEPLNHAASSQFMKRGVTTGSRVYVVSVRKGVLYLIGRMEVQDVLSQGEAERMLGMSLWKAPEHIAATAGSATPMRFDRVVPYELAKQLLFEAANGKYSPLKYEREGYLDKQTLRGVRRLSDSSAALLDKQVLEAAGER